MTDPVTVFDAARAAEVCPTCGNEGVVERLATPDEVDEGCELGIAFDPCPNERWHNPGWTPYLTDRGDSAPVGESFNDSTGGVA